MTSTSFVRPGMALLFAILLQAMVPVPPAAATDAASQEIEGTWLTQAKSEITITPCAADYCGNISKIVVPPDLYKENKQAIDSIGATNFTDQMNKDPTLRNRTIMGLQILTLHAGDKPRIFDGQIYNPQDGNTYSGYVEVLGPDKIRLNGCILYNIICKGEEWTRVPTPEPAAADAGAAVKTSPTPATHAGKSVDAAPAVSAGSFQ